MKLIKITTDLEMSIHEFPLGDYKQQNSELIALIGNECELYERVLPRRLYTELRQVTGPTKIAGQGISMLVDEEGFLKKESVPNLIGSYLYEAEKHGNPIVGNVLFVGIEQKHDGISFCGIEESVFEALELKLNNMVYMMKALKEVIL